MAIAEMERLAFSFHVKHLDKILLLMQGFQGIQIETGFETTIPAAAKAKIDADIKETERKLRDIQTAFSILKGRESAEITKMLKSVEEKQLSNTELTRVVEESDWEEILNEIIQTDRKLKNNRKRRNEITELFDQLKIWEPINVDPSIFDRLNQTIVLFGSVHIKHAQEFADKLLQYEEAGIGYETVAERGDRIWFLVAHHHSLGELLATCFDEFSFSREDYPFDKPQQEKKNELKIEENKLLEEEKEISKAIADQEKYIQILQFAEDYNLNILLRKQKSLEITYQGEEIVIEELPDTVK